MALPTPQMKVTGFGARKAAASAAPSTEKPRGLSRSEAILARNLLCDRPIDTVMPISASTRLANRASVFAGDEAVQARGAGKIEEGFVDRQRLDERREVEHARAHLAPGGGVFRHVRPHHLGMRAEPARLEHRHRRAHAVGAGDVAGGGDDAAVAAADDQRLVAQRRVVALLDRRIEGVAVDMGDGELCELGVAHEPRRAAGGAAVGAARSIGKTVTAEAIHGVARC